MEAQLQKIINRFLNHEEIKKKIYKIIEYFERLDLINNKMIKNDKLIKLLDNSKDELEHINILIKRNLIFQDKSKDLLEKINLFSEKIKRHNKFMQEHNFKWYGGKLPATELIETDDGYRIIFDKQSRSFKYKNYINIDTMIVCKDREDALIKAKDYLYNYFLERDKIINQYRYLSPDVIEVKTSNNNTFITNSCNLELVEKYNIYALERIKYGKIICKIDNIKKPFAEFICEYSQFAFANDCSYDLRRDNLIENDNGVIEKYKDINKEIPIEDGTTLKEIFNKDGYPINKWILGKYAGTVFQRKESKIWSIALKKEDNSMVTKTLKFTDETKDEVYKQAIKIKNDLSDFYELTKNKIRIINDDIIEVKLSKNQIMITDYNFLDIIQKNPLFASKSEGDNAKYYAAMLFGKKNKLFHNVITGYEMVDHIDRNTLNNCMNNLRKADHKLNNNNRSKSESSKAIELGVTYCPKDHAYRARIKQDNKEYMKQFSIKKYGKEEALNLAREYRKDYNKLFSCKNG